MKSAPKQKRSILTKEKIKETSKKLFSEQGYYRVTSNMIAKEAKVPIGSFYNYFGNKKGVLLELIRESNERFHKETIEKYQEMTLELKTPEDASKFIYFSLVDTLLSNYLSDPFYKIIHSLQFTEADVLALSEEIRTREVDLISLMLHQIARFHPLQNIPIKAKLIHSTIENVGLYVHLLGSNIENEAWIEETTSMIYRYLFNDESA